MKTRSDDACDYFPQSFGLGSLHDINGYVPHEQPKKRKIGFVIPKPTGKKQPVRAIRKS